MKTVDELKKMDAPALQAETQLLRKEFFNLKIGLITGQVKDVSQFKKLRAQVSRALTLASQKQRVVVAKQSKV